MSTLSETLAARRSRIAALLLVGFLVPCSAFAHGAELDRRWSFPGTVLHPAANRPIESDRDAELRLNDPNDASYFPLLLHAVERYLRDPRPELRPVLVMFAAGGGTDVATAAALAMWQIQGLATHPWLAATYAAHNNGATLGYHHFLGRQSPLEVAIISTAETKLGHQDAAYPHSATKETLAYHRGSLIPGANLPWTLLGGRDVVVDDEEGMAVMLESLRGVAENSRFARQIGLPFARSELIVGRPLADVKLLPLLQRLLPLVDLYHFSLDGHGVREARREMALLVRHLARRWLPRTAEGALRPVLITVADPGGDTIAKDDPAHISPTLSVSAINEALAMLAIEDLMRGQPSSGVPWTPSKVQLAPGYFGVDRESTAQGIRIALRELSERYGAVAGGIEQMPPWIPRVVLAHFFGGDGAKPLLQGHANPEAMRRAIWYADHAADTPYVIGNSPTEERAEKAFARLMGRGLSATTYPGPGRQDIPGGSSSPLTLGELTGKVIFLAPAALAGQATVDTVPEGGVAGYLVRSWRIPPAEVGRLSWGPIAELLERNQGVESENRTAAIDELEVAKLLLIAAVPRAAKLVPASRQRDLLPKDLDGRATYFDDLPAFGADQRWRSGNAPALEATAGLFGTLDHPSPLALDLVRQHVRHFLDDAERRANSTTGVLRMSSGRLLAFLHHDYPRLHAYLVAHPRVQTAIIDRLRQLWGTALIETLAQELEQQPRLLEEVRDRLHAGENPAAFDEVHLRRASLILHILRLNPHYGGVLVDPAAGSWPETLRRRIAEAHVAAVGAWLRARVGWYAARKAIDPSVLRLDGTQRDQALVILRGYLRRKGQSDGGYEKVLKALAQLMVMNLYIGDDRAAREAGWLLHNVLPGRIGPLPPRDVPPHDPFADLNDPSAPFQLVDAVQRLHKRDRRWLELIVRRTEAFATNRGDRAGDGNVAFMQGLWLAALVHGLDAKPSWSRESMPPQLREPLAGMLELADRQLRQEQAQLDELIDCGRDQRASAAQRSKRSSLDQLVAADLNPLGETPKAMRQQYRRIIRETPVSADVLRSTKARIAQIRQQQRMLGRLRSERSTADHRGGAPMLAARRSR